MRMPRVRSASTPDPRFVLVVLLVVLPALAAGLLPGVALGRGADVTLIVATRDGLTDSLVFKHFDNKRLLFKLEAGDQAREIPLRQIAMISFAGADSVAAGEALADSADTVVLRNGDLVRGVVCRLDEKHTRLFLSGKDTQATELDNATIGRIAFGPGVLDVDRHEYGTGFNLISDDLEIALATGFAEDIASTNPVLEDSLTTNYINALGRRIAAGSKRPDIEYTFAVINSRVVNAFTIGGGKVFVYRGLIEQMANEAELAGILAHEVGHIVGRHAGQNITSALLMQGIIAGGSELIGGKNAKRREVIEQAGGAIAFFRQLKYSRDDEREADFLATYNLYRTGYDPRAMTTVFETLRRSTGGDPSKIEVFFQDHPSWPERIENTGAELPKLPLDNLRLDSDSFPGVKAHLAQLPYPLQRVDIGTAKVPVASGSYHAVPLKLNPAGLQDYVLRGSFIASGGSGNDVRVFVFDTTNFLNWKNGHEARALYQSGVITAAELNLSVTEAGDYYLVLDNTFSMLSDKTVASEVFVEYRE